MEKKKKVVLDKVDVGKIKELHEQLNIMAEEADIPQEFFYVRYCGKIASETSFGEGKSLTEVIDYYISFCKRATAIYAKIVESDIKKLGVGCLRQSPKRKR